MRVPLKQSMGPGSHGTQLRVLRAQAVVLHPQALAVLIEQFRLGHAASHSQVPILD